MIKNYLKIVWRNFIFNKVFTIINIFGLSLGLSVSLIMILFVTHELSFDKFHEKSDYLYKIGFENTKEGYFIPWMSYNFGETVKNNNAEVLGFFRYKFEETVLINTDNNDKNYEQNFIFTEPSFFRLTSFKIISGNPEKDLNDPFNIYLTEKMARKYFDNKNPIGQNITFNKTNQFKVVGIVADPPSNSSIQFNFIASLSSHRYSESQRIGFLLKGKELSAELNRISTGEYFTYFQINDKNSINKIEKSIQYLITDKFNKESKYYLEPISFQHLKAKENNSYLKETYIETFASIAILILLLAIINYVNLTNARSGKRAKEIGIRKAIGANQKSLIFQFYLESLVYSLISIVFACIIFSLLKNNYLQFQNINIDTSFILNNYFIVPVLGIFFLTFILTGSYPSIVLASFLTSQVIKGNFINKNSNKNSIRNYLTIFQYGVAALLIICGTIAFQQISFMLNKDIGLNRQRILAIKLEENVMDKKYKQIKREIDKLVEVEETAGINIPLFSNYGNVWEVKTDKNKNAINIKTMLVDNNFTSILGIKWIEIPSNPNHLGKNSIIINEAAAKKLMITNDYKNKELLFGDRKKMVAGIAKDFVIGSLKDKITPTALFFTGDSSTCSQIYVKFTPKTNKKELINSIEKIYNKYKIDSPFEYYFIDDAYKKLYDGEIRFKDLLISFSILGLIIASLGLLGLTIFIAESKIKEIGIRKVLGASLLNILQLFSKHVIKLLLISMIFAFPIAFYLMDNWLQNFAYKIEVSWHIFAFCFITILISSLLIISYIAIKAALLNPVKSLKTE